MNAVDDRVVATVIKPNTRVVSKIEANNFGTVTEVTFIHLKETPTPAVDIAVLEDGESEPVYMGRDDFNMHWEIVPNKQ
jgi:hypothetical protein